MNTQDLVNQLNHPDDSKRLEALRIIYMVEEVTAIARLEYMQQHEASPAVLDLLPIVIGRLKKLQRDRYDTILQIYEQFGVYKEIKLLSDPQVYQRWLREARQSQTSEDVIQAHEIRTGQLKRATGHLSSGTGRLRVESNMRLPARQPATSNILPYLQRIAATESPQNRVKLIQETGRLLHPGALPLFAELYVRDPISEVKRAAREEGKRIYWNGIYYDLVESGKLDMFIEQQVHEYFGTTGNRRRPAASSGNADSSPFTVAVNADEEAEFDRFLAEQLQRDHSRDGSNRRQEVAASQETQSAGLRPATGSLSAERPVTGTLRTDEPATKRSTGEIPAKKRPQTGPLPDKDIRSAADILRKQNKRKRTSSFPESAGSMQPEEKPKTDPKRTTGLLRRLDERRRGEDDS